MRSVVRELVRAVEPFDELEGEHRADVLAWIDSGAGIFRTAKPATPPKHLVSYCLVVDPDAERALLVDHRDAERWLPTGGHVEPGEHPVAAATRELQEELGIRPPFHHRVGEVPLLVTVTPTAGRSQAHTDVSLWFVFEAPMSAPVAPDEGEFHGVRWWPFDEITPSGTARFDPHLPRFIAKLRTLV